MYNYIKCILKSHFTYVPLADTGDCTEGVTDTVIGMVDILPVALTITSINPDDSEPTNCSDANSTTITSNINVNILDTSITI